MGVKIEAGFTGTATNNNTRLTPEQQYEIDRRQLQIEANYITHDGLKHITPPQPLIHNWLYQNSLAWLAGKPGDGKSFIALDMAYSVATGQPWQNHPTHQGTVLYIAAEGASGLSTRADAWTKAHGNPDYIPIFFLPTALRLVNPTELDTQALTQALTALQPSLVIIDTQARVTTGAEENSAKDMGWFIDALETLRAAHPATYLTVHHTPRNGDNLRGSIALEGAAETVLLSVKDGDVVTLKCQKQKNAPQTDDLQMAMTPIGDSIILSSEAVELVGKMTKIMEQLLRALVEELRREAGSTELREHVGISSGGNFSRPITALVNEGFVTMRTDGNRRFYQATTKGQLHLLRNAPQAPGATEIASSNAPHPFRGGATGATPTSGGTE
jgi:hypothetical protein